MKKVLVWIAIILIVVWVINRPGKAANLIDKVSNAFTTIGTSL